MGTTKLENNHMKKYMEFVLSNFVIIAFVVLFIASCFLTPAFLTVNNIKSVLIQNSIYAICAIGMLLIIITGGIDLSTGSYVCIIVCLTAGLIQKNYGVVAILIVLALALVIGAISGIMVAILNITFHSNIGDDNYIKRCSIYVPDGSEQTYRWNIPS